MGFQIPIHVARFLSPSDMDLHELRLLETVGNLPM